MADLVKMVRVEDGKEADVHPDMVEDYKRGNYAVAERARKEDGTFQADDPATPENEAYKPAPKKRGRPKRNAG